MFKEIDLHDSFDAIRQGRNAWSLTTRQGYRDIPKAKVKQTLRNYVREYSGRIGDIRQQADDIDKIN